MSNKIVAYVPGYKTQCFNSYDGYDDKNPKGEAYKGERKLGWLMREIPPVTLLIAMLLYVGNAFGYMYYVIVLAIIAPVLMWLVIAWILDCKYH